MPIFKHPDAVKSMVELMTAYIEITFPNVDTLVGKLDSYN